MVRWEEKGRLVRMVIDRPAVTVLAESQGSHWWCYPSESLWVLVGNGEYGTTGAFGTTIFSGFLFLEQLFAV